MKHFTLRGLLQISFAYSIFIFLWLGLVNSTFCQAQDSLDSSASNSETASETEIFSPRRPYTLSTTNGIENGNGQASYKGPRLQNAAAVSFRQVLGKHRFSESMNFSTDTKIKSWQIVEGNASASLKYIWSGFSLSVYTGRNYANFIYNSLSRQETIQSAATWSTTLGGKVGKEFYLDDDSTLSLTPALAYDGFIGAYHTVTLSLSIEKDWDDFVFSSRVYGSQQKMDSLSGTCSRFGKDGSCLVVSTTELTHGMGGSAELEWTLGKHVFTISSGLDAYITPSTKSGVLGKIKKSSVTVQRTLTNSFAYTYSVNSWLDLDSHGEYGFDLAAKTSSTFWLAGLSCSLTY